MNCVWYGNGSYEIYCCLRYCCNLCFSAPEVASVVHYLGNYYLLAVSRRWLFVLISVFVW